MMKLLSVLFIALWLGVSPATATPAPGACKSYWNAAWQDAKEGSVRARHYINLMLGREIVSLPGHGADEASIESDRLILLLHALGETELTQKIAADPEEFFEEQFASYPAFERNSAFKACMLAKFSADCTAIAVNAGLIPSFEEFSRMIDQAIANGLGVKCKPTYGFMWAQ